MRIRKPFAGAFAGMLLLSGYLGLAPRHYEMPAYKGLESDKVLHFFTFFVITVTFYWIVETSRTKILRFTLLICTAILGVGSEIAQGLLPNGREFDIYDIAANVLGSLSGLALCAWYHRRMLERKRASKRFGSLDGDEEAGLSGGEPGPEEVELQEGTGAQESGVTRGGRRETDLDAELDNWDENAEDWDEDEQPAANGAKGEPTAKAPKRVN